MTMPRRRLVRPLALPAASQPQRQRSLQKARTQLDQARSALARWMKRLKRALNAVCKQQHTVTRLEQKIRSLEEP